MNCALRLKNPASVRGSPRFAANCVVWPSPSAYSPYRASILRPSALSRSLKLITPAIASEPYCADAPSRSTSTCFNAIPGMTERSGPCDPSEIPPPRNEITAERCRRLPLTSISVLSGDKPRRLAGRTIVPASLIGCWLTLYEGMAPRSNASISVLPWAMKSSPLITSIGTAESVADRAARRVPVVTISSITSSAPSCACATVTNAGIASGRAKKNRLKRLRILSMSLIP